MMYVRKWPVQWIYNYERKWLQNVYCKLCESSLDDAEVLLPNRDTVLRNVFQHCLRFCCLTSFSACGKQGAHRFPPKAPSLPKHVLWSSTEKQIPASICLGYESLQRGWGIKGKYDEIKGENMTSSAVWLYNVCIYLKLWVV